LTIQILHYEFLGPVQLSDWGPPMEKLVYLIMARNEDKFDIIFADECEKTEATDFFTKNNHFKCWISNAGSEKNLYLSIYPMWDSTTIERKRVLQRIISRFKPTCNFDKE